jgi:hypothetical protein
MKRAGPAALLHLPEADRGVATKPKRQPRASKRILLRQASNMIAAVAFVREIGSSQCSRDDPLGRHRSGG